MARTRGTQVGRIAVGAALVVAYLLLALAGRELGVFGPLSVWYPPAGLALAAGLLVGWAALPVLAVAELLGGALVFSVGDDFTVLQQVVNALAYATVWCGAGEALRRNDVRVPIASVRDAVTAMLVGLLAAPATAATVGVAMRLWADAADPARFLADVGVWWTGDAIGVVTLAPALLVLETYRRGDALRPLREVLPPTPRTAVLLAGPTVTAAVLFGVLPQSTGLLYLVAAPLVLTALHLGTVGVALACLPLSAALTWMANRSVGDLVLQRTDVQVLLLGVMVTGYLVAVPIEQGRRLADRLRRRERELEEAQRLARMGSFRWDAETDRIRWSPGLSLLYGLPPGQTPGGVEDHLAAIREDRREEVAAAIASVAAGGGPVEHTYPITRADGAERWVTARVEAVRDGDGAVRGLAGYCQDVTDRQRVETARRRATAREREATQRLQQTERMKDALLMAVSHEFRTPLTIVAGMVATLGRPAVREDPELVAPLVDRLQHQLARLDGLLTDLLDTDRLARGTVVPHLRTADLHDVVESVLTFHDLSSHDVEIAVDVDTAVVDAGLLARMVEGLLVNAVRYTPPGTAVTLRLRGEDDDLLLEVADRGPGVAPGQREAIFEAFHQDRRIAHAPGTGLGLYLVARFAELHGGTAWVEDRDGGGARFLVRLPAAVRYRMLPGA